MEVINILGGAGDTPQPVNRMWAAVLKVNKYFSMPEIRQLIINAYTTRGDGVGGQIATLSLGNLLHLARSMNPEFGSFSRMYDLNVANFQDVEIPRTRRAIPKVKTKDPM